MLDILALLTPVFPSLSDPAKSTKWSFEDSTLAMESTRERDCSKCILEF